MWMGFAFGVMACMLWGFIYLVPLVLPGYDPAFIAAGRYVSFGLVALPLIWIERKEFRHYTWADWWCVTKLGVIGNIVYYWFLILCIQNAGAPLAGMCMAIIPVLTSIIANKRSQKGGSALPWRKLMPSLCLITVGLITANWTEFERVVDSDIGSVHSFCFGTAMGIAALLLWTWYPIRNAEWLLAHPKRHPRAWSTAQGLVTLPFAALFYVLFWYYNTPQQPFLGDDPLWFALVVTTSGLVCSWIGIMLWNAMSQRLPTALSGQMIVFETIFAIIYAHALRLEFPSMTMIIGALCLITGVLSALNAFQRQARCSQNGAN